MGDIALVWPVPATGSARSIPVAARLNINAQTPPIILFISVLPFRNIRQNDGLKPSE